MATLPLRISLYLHALLELPAALTFYITPSTHLPPYPSKLSSRPSSDLEVSWISSTEPILHSYGLLLLSSSFIAVATAQPDMPASLARPIALFLAMYHFGPIRRATGRIRRDQALQAKPRESVPVMKNPKLHLVLHVIVGGLLTASAIMGYLSD